jgi:hypothetical protein
MEDMKGRAMSIRRLIRAVGAVGLLAGCATVPPTVDERHPAHPGAAATAVRPLPETLAIGEDGGEATTRPATADVYTCPMHPEVVADGPGTCPECGMKLTPRVTEPEKEGGHAHDHH